MARPTLTIDEILAILQKTPGHLRACSEGRTDAELRTPPSPDEWSANDVLAHLRACHDVLGGSMLRIIREAKPEWKGLNPRAWIKRTDYPEWAFGDAFAAFKEQRRELLEVLEPLTADAWDRTATVIDMVGKRFERDVVYFGTWMASHERTHWKQLAKLSRAQAEDG